MVTEVNFVAEKADWMIDCGATRHIGANRELLTEFEEATGVDLVFMGNSATVQVLGKGKVTLKLTSGKSLTLQNVLFVPSMCRNLISSTLLEIVGIKQVIASGKIVLSKNDEFVGKAYRTTGLLYVLQTVIDNKFNSSAYIVETLDL